MGGALPQCLVKSLVLHAMDCGHLNELQVTISPPSLELAWHGAQLQMSKLNDVLWCVCVSQPQH